jgi:hypothetical protein
MLKALLLVVVLFSPEFGRGLTPLARLLDIAEQPHISLLLDTTKKPRIV